MGKKRIGILTGGGDVPPLNAVIASVQRTCREEDVELFGFLRGWRGVLENEYVNLDNLDLDPSIGGTILKSSRLRLDRLGGRIEQALRNLHSADIQGLIVVGGEDTLSNCFNLPEVSQVLISKTIDNDVGMIRSDPERTGSAEIINYFTLGFPTAARKISSFVSLKEGLRTTAYSHERVMIVESMGMHAGWLALSSSMGHPDFIIIPEFPLDYEGFVHKVLERYDEKKNVIAVVAEGAHFSDGSHVSADEDEKDDFGHPRFKGAAEVLSRKLKKDLKGHLNPRNVNSVNPSYLYRSGSSSALDREGAENLGREAVRLHSRGLERSTLLTVRNEDNGFAVYPYPLSNIRSIEAFHRFVDRRFYDPDDYSVTAAGKTYLSRIVEEIPEGRYGI